ncbi:uncharacterized protein FTOL_03274 [Fusarium torulosum]|uniref:F-box domain-containing protein n=1 Tax=Fusarium torulosum TaxID=33205 RepID=A0AAE8SFJ9_9HYPO|nr:uncharacterized protein FTOL_03274 [Fusarium torulosum]
MSGEINIQSLPVELLNKILSHVSEDRKNGQESIKQSRLVSRHLNNVASLFLIPEVTVCLTLESFTRLEEICSHPLISKGVRKATIMLCFYEEELANNRRLYMREARSRLLRHCETMERMWRYKRHFYWTDELHNWLSHMAWDRCPKLNQMVDEDTTQDPPAQIQKLFLRLYDMYKKRYEEQEILRQDNRHISRLVAALSSLPSLTWLNLKDFSSSRALVSSHKQPGADQLLVEDFLDIGYSQDVLRHFDRGVRPSAWCGSFATEDSASPPVEMLGELCSQLGSHGVRLGAFTLFIYPPPDMRMLQSTLAQQENIKKLVSEVEYLTIGVDSPIRTKVYSREEMLALGSVIKPLASSPNLHYLRVDLEHKAHTSAVFSMDDLIPSDTPWPRLQSLRFLYLRIKLEELRSLVSRLGKTLLRLDWHSVYFPDCSPSEVLDAMRGFQALEEVHVDYPDGGQFLKDPGSPLARWPKDEVRRYLLREADVYPLD